MNQEHLYLRYQELQRYVGWDMEDARRVPEAARCLEPALPGIIDDFYLILDQHPDARKVITGGQAQILRLKGTLLGWLKDLLAGVYDSEYVVRRWRAARRSMRCWRARCSD